MIESQESKMSPVLRFVKFFELVKIESKIFNAYIYIYVWKREKVDSSFCLSRNIWCLEEFFLFDSQVVARHVSAPLFISPHGHPQGLAFMNPSSSSANRIANH